MAWTPNKNTSFKQRTTIKVEIVCGLLDLTNYVGLLHRVKTKMSLKTHVH